jgi:hypothetical protein
VHAQQQSDVMAKMARMIQVTLVVLCLFLTCCIFSGKAICWDKAASVGYGFAAYNQERHLGKVEGGSYYDFLLFTLIFERSLSSSSLNLLVEPFIAYVNRPNSGADVGFDVGLKYYFSGSEREGFYITIGAGAAYTTISFKEQGTHVQGVLTGGVGFRHKNLFVENRFRHYSNGHTAYPNWSINTNILTVGTYF